MKKKILDEPFDDIFSNHLEKNEKIIWREEIQNGSFIFISIWGMIVFASMFNLFTNPSLIAFLVVLFLMLSIFLFPNFHRSKQSAKIKYAISTKRIFLQQKGLGKRASFSIPFEDIARINVTTNSSNSQRGNVFILIKNKKKHSYEKYDFAFNGQFEVPTLQQINEPHEVAKLIRQQIQQNN